MEKILRSRQIIQRSVVSAENFLSVLNLLSCGGLTEWNRSGNSRKDWGTTADYRLTSTARHRQGKCMILLASSCSAIDQQMWASWRMAGLMMIRGRETEENQMRTRGVLAVSGGQFFGLHSPVTLCAKYIK